MQGGLAIDALPALDREDVNTKPAIPSAHDRARDLIVTVSTIRRPITALVLLGPLRLIVEISPGSADASAEQRA